VKRSISSKLTLGLIAAGGALMALPAWAEGKIGIVDFQRLGMESPQGKTIQDSMRAEFAPRQRTLQAQEQSIKAKQEKLQKDGATMSEDQRVRAEKELRDSARDLQRAEGEFNDDVTARRNEELSKLQRTLLEEVRTYAKAQNYDVVLSGEAVVYATQAYDITPAILSALESHAPAGGRSAAPPAKPQPSAAPPAKPQPK
jgi:outer membrane protein